MTFMELKHKLIDLHLSQSELARTIEKRYNEKLRPSELGNIMRNVQVGDKAERVKQEVEIILSELESGAGT